MNKRSFIVAAFALLGCFRLFGQESRKEIRIGFRVGTSTADTAYDENAARLSEILSFLENVQEDSTLHLTGAVFSGSASPEGGTAVNKRLADERRASLEQYIRKHITLPDCVVSRSEGFVAWERLAELAEHSDMPHKEEAVEVLRNVPELTCNKKGVPTDSRKKRLMDLRHGSTWHYMLEHFFPKIRNAGVVFTTTRQKEEAEQEPAIPAPEPLPRDTTATQAANTSTPAAALANRKPFYIAVRTNLLHDALAVPNLGVEFCLGKSLSVAGNWMYAWWKSDRKHNYWRTYGGDIALRYRFGRKAKEHPLAGHHLGLYGQILTYDFERGGRGYLGDKWSGGGGVEYGYSLPVAQRLNVDFSLGVGYLTGTYQEYLPIDNCYVWQSTKRRRWFGPTKAEVSLVWLIGRGNRNRKGGRA